MAGLTGAGPDEDEMIAVINTTPLVDVMLVLLVIFLITVPVVIHTVPLSLPNDRDQDARTRPGAVILSVDRVGTVYWNDQIVPDDATLVTRLQAVAPNGSHTEVELRADRDVPYASVGKVVADCERAGVTKLAFITQPSLQAH